VPGSNEILGPDKFMSYVETLFDEVAMMDFKRKVR
jgi:hypothetical protein